MSEEQEPRSQFERDVIAGKVDFDPTTGESYETTSWRAVDLGPVLRGEKVIEPPCFMTRSDGKHLVYPGRAHVFFGESESLKSYGALFACKSVVAAGLRVVYIDFEDDEVLFVERAREIGIPDTALGTAIVYIRPHEPLIGNRRAGIDFFLHEMDMLQPSLAVIDGVTECYSLHDWNINSAEDAAKYQHTFSFRGACASIAIDHTAKDAGRGQIGSQHKRAGLTGASYQFDSRQKGGPPTATEPGRASVAFVRVHKDRPGRVRAWTKDVAAVLTVDPDKGVTLEAPTFGDRFDPKTDAQDKVLAVAKETPGLSGSAIAVKTGIQKSRVLEALVDLQFKGKVRNEGSEARPRWVPVTDS
jgi:hypothetical protein